MPNANSNTSLSDLVDKISDLCTANSNECIDIKSNLTKTQALIDKIKKSLDVVDKKLAKYAFKIKKPFIKWVGGKTQIINDVLNTFPKTMNNYHEMFVGGGSVLFGMLSSLEADMIQVNGDINAYDLNKGLIYMYKHVKNNHVELFNLMHEYMNTYDNCPANPSGDNLDRKPATETIAKKCRENYYYWIRKRFNDVGVETVEHAALFIVINKTAFRGMYREGPNGYNVPFGHYKTTPQLCTKGEFASISAMLQRVNFHCCDFTKSFKNVSTGDFVYLDPPYAPIDKKSFVGYTAGGFNLSMHEKLFELAKGLKSKKATFTMSNACVKLVTESFKDYDIKKIVCRRAINSKKPGSTATEVLITS
jgi:DNA adenine methylase